MKQQITQIIPGDGECEYCNKVAELRPYGKNGAFICFSCGMKNEDETKKQLGKILSRGNLIIGKPSND